ncbi:MAG: hypothetical protein PHW77_05935 [Eubacteriales bacterium]|nr:hypothetical protein [Eubacteriales bacterium]
MFIIIALLVAVILFVVIITSSSDIEGIQAELIEAGGEVIPDGTNVIFNNVIADLSDDISYDPATGEFTVTSPGVYIVNWWVAPDGAGAAINISFTVAVDGVPYSTASSPIVSVQMGASAIIDITTVPAVITLVNTTGDDVFIPDIPVQAGIVIYK